MKAPDPNCNHCHGTGEYEVKGCTCGGGSEYGAHEPGCGLEQCICTADFVDDVVAQSEADSPGFAAKVEEAYQARTSRR